MNKRFLTGLVAAGLIAGVVTGCSKGPGSASGRFLTEPVAVGDVEKAVLATGTLQPLEVVNVGAQATGQIQSLKVQLGDVVRKGQLLAVIDPSIQLNTLENAQAALAAQEGRQAVDVDTLNKAQLDLSRQKSLMARGFAAQAAYDQAAAQVAIAKATAAASAAQVRQARIQVDKAKVDLGRTNIIAPIDGVVAAILVREGQTVNAVQMAPTLLRLAKMDVMTVRAQVSEADVINVRPGQTVWFTILGDADRRYYAKLRSVDPAPDSAGDTLTAPANTAIYYNAVFDVPNADGRLRSSMTAQVNIILGEAKGVLTGPAGALGTKGKDGLYPVKVLKADGTTSDRKVRVGVIDNARFQVLSGLSQGDKLVIGDAWNAKISGLPAKGK
jgi:macrolide-specific efflux system membrane fusion protein